MKVMVMLKATPRSEAGLLPDEKLLAEIQSYNDQLAKAGILVAMGGLHPSSKGIRVRLAGETKTVSEGPFSNTAELVSGYWIWQVKDLTEAADWIKRYPNPAHSPTEVEIRPLFESGVIESTPTSDLREQDAIALANSLELHLTRFENGPELLIAGLEQNYMFVSQAMIRSQWERFMPIVNRIPGRVGKNYFGAGVGHKSDGGIGYLSGVEVSATSGLPSEYSSKTIPAQRYAVFKHDDHVSTIAKTIDTIRKKWVTASGLDSQSTLCLERYSEEFNPQTGMGGMEIWIPVKR